MTRSSSSLLGVVFFAVATACATSVAVHAGTVWQHDGSVPAPPSFGLTHLETDVPLAFGPEGGVLAEARSPTSKPLFVRFDAAGSVGWSVELPSAGTLAMIATADGGAYLLAYDYAAVQLIRVDSTGAKAWSRPVPGERIALAGSGRIASSGTDWLTVLDAASGDVAWQRRINQDRIYNDVALSLVADPGGNLYVTTGVHHDALSGIRTIKFDAAGNEQWNVVVAAATRAEIVAVAGSLLYERIDGELRAVRIGDGGIAWNVPIDPSATVLASGGGASEPIVIDATSARRLAADTGQARWTRTLSPGFGLATIVGGKVVATTASQIVAIDAATGLDAWATALPTTDTYGSPLALQGFGALDGDLFFTVGRVQGTYSNAPLFLRRIHASSGAFDVAMAVPSVQQETRAGSIAQGPDHAISVFAAPRANAVDLQVRRIDAATGTVAWQLTDALDDFGGTGVFYPSRGIVLAEHAGKAAATTTLGNCSSGPSGLRVALYDVDQGARLWHALLTDPGRTCTYSYDAQLDDAGNVFVSASEGPTCGNLCYDAAIYKLASSDGHVVWRDALEGDYTPRAFVLAGDRIVSTVPFHGGATFEGLSAADGAAAWSTTLYGGYDVRRYVFKVDASHVVVVGETGTGTSWAKLDATTGTVLWDRSVAHAPCADLCFENAPAVLSNGDLLIHGKLGARALLRRFHNDGSGTVDEWFVGAEAPAQQAWINRAEADADGRLDLQLARRPGAATPPSIHTFARFDMTSGVLSDEQFLAAYSQDPYEQLVYPDLLRQVDADRFLVQTYATRPPQTATTGVALLDFATTAHGDLAIEAHLDRPSAVIGDTMGFHLRATYTGDAAVQGATLFAHMPWPSGVAAPACTTSSAGNCVVDVDSGDVRATFDVLPGGSIDISGSVRVLGYPERPLLSAYVHGTTELGESDLRNNFTAAEPSVFVDGFDAH